MAKTHKSREPGLGGRIERHYLTRQEAAEYIGHSKKTLANWASNRTGPRFIKPSGKALYDVADLDLWASSLGTQATATGAPNPATIDCNG